MTKEINPKHNARLYVEPSDSPKLVISTNLDQNVQKENPYQLKEEMNKQEFEEFLSSKVIP